MYHGCKTRSNDIGDDDVIDDIIKSKSRSTFWTAVTLLIFKLERRTNTQKEGNWTGYLDIVLISKSSQSLQLSSLCYELSSFWKFWQVRNLWLLFHLFVFLSVSHITEKRQNGFSWNFQGRWDLIQGTIGNIFRIFHLTPWTQEFLFHFFGGIHDS